MSNFAEVMNILSKERVRTQSLAQPNSWGRLPKELGDVTVVKGPDYQRREEQGESEQGIYIVHIPAFQVYLELLGELDSYGDNETFPYLPREVKPVEKVVTVYDYE